MFELTLYPSHASSIFKFNISNQLSAIQRPVLANYMLQLLNNATSWCFNGGLCQLVFKCNG
jgi:hypothetical protein